MLVQGSAIQAFAQKNCLKSASADCWWPLWSLTNVNINILDGGRCNLMTCSVYIEDLLRDLPKIIGAGRLGHTAAKGGLIKRDESSQQDSVFAIFRFDKEPATSVHRCSALSTDNSRLATPWPAARSHSCALCECTSSKVYLLEAMGPVHNQGKQSGLLSKRQKRKTQARDALSATIASSTAATKTQLDSGHLDATSRPVSSDPQTPPAVDTRKLCSDFSHPAGSVPERASVQKHKPSAVAASPHTRPYVYPIDANSSQAALNSGTPDAAPPAAPTQTSASAASSAFSIFSDASTLQEKVNCILDRFQATAVVQRLVDLKVPELVAQRACLEVAQSNSKIDTDAALDYIKAHNNPAELNRCVCFCMPAWKQWIHAAWESCKGKLLHVYPIDTAATHHRHWGAQRGVCLNSIGCS